MIVCQCKGTTDATIRRAIRAGATTIGEVGALCLAGTDCGGCHETIAQIIRSEQQSAASRMDPARPGLPQPSPCGACETFR